MDRTPKIPLELIAEATAGARDGWAREELLPEQRVEPTGPPEQDNRTTPDSVFLSQDVSTSPGDDLDSKIAPEGLDGSQSGEGNP